MLSRNFLLLGVLASSLLASCAVEQKKQEVEGSMCKDPSGNMTNIAQIYGQWKKIEGYIDGRDDAELRDHDYNILIVEKGGAMCQVTVEAQGVKAIAETGDKENYVGTYKQDVLAKTLAINYTKGADGASNDSVSFSFSSDCKRPTMTLTYENNAVLDTEVYLLQTKNVSQGTCSGSK
jgi:hypothetical protein